MKLVPTPLAGCFVIEDQFFGDERFVPLDHPDRNEHQGLEAFPGLQANLLRYPATGDLTEAAKQFSEVLQTRFGDLDGDQPVFDFAIVGMGPDGHIASLFPGHRQEKAWVIRRGRARWLGTTVVSVGARLSEVFPLSH